MPAPIIPPTEFDLQPDPRILPMLGEINLLQWRCLAEFIDNSVDSFLAASRAGTPIAEPQIYISIPTSDTGAAKVTVRDNGPGMDTATLERAVRAGWTSNDPMHNLGMFGMGFNIATARLGGVTRVWTTKAGDAEWSGLEIDFDQLVRQKHFRTPRLTRPKADTHEHGTEVSVERLKPEQRQWLAKTANRSKLSRDHFAVVYSAMLRRNGIPIPFELFVNNTLVVGRNHCVWGGEGNPARQITTTRYGVVSAYQTIDHRMPDREFCVKCWQWLPQGDHVCPACDSKDQVVTRARRIYGWLGVQRYAHETEYGIDFIRNGRKIEVGNKDLFQWDTGSVIEPEYPIDDPRHRGRIVGEVHIDHCRVTYTKDRFDRNDPAWEEMVQIVRGEGPLRPDRAAELGHRLNSSPLFLLYQGFRRNQPHQKVAGAYAKLLTLKENDQAEAMAKRFYAGEPEFQSDAKWWELVEESDRALLGGSGPNPGTGAGPGGLLGFGAQGGVVPPVVRDGGITPPPAPLPIRVPIASLSQEYQDRVSGQRWKVRAFRVGADDPAFGGVQVPWAMRATPGGEHEFFVNEGHEAFRSATLTPLDALLAHLAWAAMDFARGNQQAVTFPAVLSGLRDNYATASRLEAVTLTSEASQALTSVVRALSGGLSVEDARALFAELTPAEQEAIQSRMAARTVRDPQQVIDEGRFFKYAPWPILLRFMESHPELFFDNRCWDVPYSILDYGHATATDAAKARVVRQYAALMTDAIWLAEQDPGDLATVGRARLLRCSLAIDLLATTANGATTAQ